MEEQEVLGQHSDLVDRILQNLSHIQRLSWYPVIDKDETEEDVTNMLCTKFGGNKPFRPDNFVWPICDECNAHKAFVCQINLGTLPPMMQDHCGLSSGLFQVFYCLECMPLYCFKDVHIIKESAFIPSLKSLAASVTVKQKNFVKTDLPQPLRNYVEDYTEDVPQHQVYGGDDLDTRIVDSWKPFKSSEIPLHCEIQAEHQRSIQQRTNLTESQFDLFYRISEDCQYEDKSVTFPNSGVKIGGYIRWCQDVEYPDCPDCKVSMRVSLLQMEEHAGVYEFMWGDCGTAHVTLCPRCHRPALHWACS